MARSTVATCIFVNDIKIEPTISQAFMMASIMSCSGQIQLQSAANTSSIIANLGQVCPLVSYCLRLIPNPNALVAISKGMQAVKLCTDKILHFLSGSAG